MTNGNLSCGVLSAHGEDVALIIHLRYYEPNIRRWCMPNDRYIVIFSALPYYIDFFHMLNFA